MNWLKRVVYSINCMLLPLLYGELDILTDGVRVQITMLTTEMTVSYCEYVHIC